MSNNNWRDCSSLNLSEICMPLSVISQETIRLRPSESLCPLNLEQLVTKSRSSGCSSSFVLRFKRSASMNVIKLCETRSDPVSDHLTAFPGTHLSRFSNLLSSLWTCLARMFDSRGYTNLNPVQRRRVIHLMSISVSSINRQAK